MSHFCDTQVLVLRLRDSVVRLGEELEQSAQAEARERENARYYQQRLQDMRMEMEELTQREQDSSRRRMELVTDLTPLLHSGLVYEEQQMLLGAFCVSGSSAESDLIATFRG